MVVELCVVGVGVAVVVHLPVVLEDCVGVEVVVQTCVVVDVVVVEVDVVEAPVELVVDVVDVSWQS